MRVIAAAFDTRKGRAVKVAHLPEPAEERVLFRDGLGVRERRDTGTGEWVSGSISTQRLRASGSRCTSE